MRPSARLTGVSVLASIVLATASSFAQDPAPTPPTAPPPAAPPPAAPPPAAPPPADPGPPLTQAAADAAPPAPPASTLPPSASPGSDPRSDARDPSEEGLRTEGVRLAVDLGYQRAFSGSEDRLNAGSPSLIPIGIDVSFHTSPSLLFGLHGYAALASRDDCIEIDSCRARAYGFGGHVETTLNGASPRRSFIPWLRYGVTYEILYQGGLPLDASGHIYRGAFDFLNLRIGGDFVVSRGTDKKLATIGPYVGVVGGFLMNQSGYTTLSGSGGQQRDLDRSSGSLHVWGVLGVRGTLDP